MNRSLQKALFDEINGYIDNNTTRLASEEMSHMASSYYDAGYAVREQAILRTEPVIVGHSTALKQPGDYLAHEDTGVPIILTRQADGGIKALLNVCRHRGAPVCPNGSGSRKLFVCPYHAWSFRFDGRLMGTPKEAFPNIDPSENGLIELPVEERHGLIWVVLTPGATIDVAAHLGPLDAELASYDLANCVMERDVVLKADINWKFVLDGFLEVYHIPKLHTDSIAPWIYGKYSPFDRFDRHSRLIGVRKSYDGVKSVDFDDVPFMKHVAVNYQIFPNTVAVWQGDHFETWTSYPGKTPGDCVVRVQSLVPKAMMEDRYKSRWDRNWKLLIDTVVSEDWAMSERVQKALPFAGGNRILFGRNEPGLQHFHSTLDQAVHQRA